MHVQPGVTWRCVWCCSPGEAESIAREVIGQLRRLAMTGSSRQDRLFLGVDMARVGYVDKETLRELCSNHHLPCDPDIIDLVGENRMSLNILTTMADFFN
jgi:hypothetical protein